MQVKVFEANDMNSGLKLIKEELGAEALIISTKTIRGGRLGLGKNRLEITAAVDNAVPPPSRREFDTMGVERPAFATDSYNELNHLDNRQENKELLSSARELPSLANPYLKGTALTPKKQQAFVAPKKTPPPPEPDVPSRVETAQPLQKPQRRQSDAFSAPKGTHDSRMHDEMHELKNLVRNLAGEVARLQPNYTGTASTEPTNALPHESSTIRFLKSKGLNQDVSSTLSTFLEAQLDPESLENKMLVTQHALQSIQGMLDVVPLLQNHKGQQRIAFVGPTGVGKTTTLAKIAAAKLSQGHQKIALITIDTYRIAAVEQIKVYGEIMNLPVDVVISPEQLEEALIRHHDCDLILIDTAGRSPKDELSIEELRTFLKSEFDIERHLVLSASTREEELIDTITRFQKLQISSTIYTKTDECSQLGSILNVQLQNNTPISCITNGQRVPEDVVDISPNAIAQLIMSIH